LDINNLFKIQGLLFSNQEKAWLEIKKINYTWKQILFYYLFPLLFLSTIANTFFMGDQLSALGFTPNQMFLATFLGSLIAILATAWMVAAMAPRFKASDSFDHHLALLAFAYSPVYLAAILSSLHEVLQILNLVAVVITLLMYYKGTRIITEVPPHKQMGFTIVSLIILFGMRLIITVIFVALLGGIPNLESTY